MSVLSLPAEFPHREQWPAHLRGFERDINVGAIPCGVPDRLLADVLTAVASSTNEREFD